MRSRLTPVQVSCRTRADEPRARAVDFAVLSTSVTAHEGRQRGKGACPVFPRFPLLGDKLVQTIFSLPSSFVPVALLGASWFTFGSMAASCPAFRRL